MKGSLKRLSRGDWKVGVINDRKANNLRTNYVILVDKLPLDEKN
jgi:hypothetical protein